MVMRRVHVFVCKSLFLSFHIFTLKIQLSKVLVSILIPSSYIAFVEKMAILDFVGWNRKAYYFG